MTDIAIILPYAVSIRDFVSTGALAELATISDARIRIYTQNPDLPELDPHRSDQLTVHAMPDYVPTRSETLLKRLYPLLFADTFFYVQQVIAASRTRRAIAKVLVTIRRILGTARTLSAFAWLLRLVSRRNGASGLQGRPDLVIGTRSTINSLDYPLLLEAARRGLRQMTVAGSWDNFTTKGFFPFRVIKTVVWNRKMADELKSIFDVPPGDIAIAGYPRRKLLNDTGAHTGAADYLAVIGLGQYRRFILYSASYAELTRTQAGAPPREYLLIREVALGILRDLPPDTCILVRLHPFSAAEDEQLFEGIDRLHVFVPGRADRYVERVMNTADEAHLAAQIRFSECIVSMASTITIDALSVGRPVINVAFEPAGATDPMISTFYSFNHFRDLVAAARLPIARNLDDVTDFVRRRLSGDNRPQADMAMFERLYVPKESDAYPQVLRQTIEELL